MIEQVLLKKLKRCDPFAILMELILTFFHFRHAGAYTAEEVIRVMRDKLIRLQKLYIDQFQRLQYLLKEEKRTYR